jgi:23S rRNA pseudouridine2605 synthase
MSPESDATQIRLQKVLASAGIGSRRACEQLIDEGRVEVDGQVVLEQGLRVDPSRQVIKVDGMRIPTAPGHVVLAFNKPRGVHSTMSDERGRPCVGDYLTGRRERLFHVGRLDADTEGLLLLTNDGELAQRLAHPSHGVPKTYLAQVRGTVPRDLGKRLRAGIELDDGPVRVDRFRVVTSAPGRALVEVVLHEGRKHVVRRLLAASGHPVEGLVRVKVGPIGLGDLRSGKVRTLTLTEVGELYAAAGL